MSASETSFWLSEDRILWYARCQKGQQCHLTVSSASRGRVTVLRILWLHRIQQRCEYTPAFWSMMFNNMYRVFRSGITASNSWKQNSLFDLARLLYVLTDCKRCTLCSSRQIIRLFFFTFSFHFTLQFVWILFFTFRMSCSFTVRA